MTKISTYLVAAVLAVASAYPAQARTPKVGEPAPDATLRLVDGETVRLSDLRGTVVVINFWATWCVPCRRELPLLDTYYRLQKPHGLRVFAATTEDSVPEYKLHGLFDRMTLEAVHRLSGPYAPLEGVPTNYVIDRAGVVRYAQAGAFSLEALNTILVPLIREPTPPTTKVATAR